MFYIILFDAFGRILRLEEAQDIFELASYDFLATTMGLGLYLTTKELFEKIFISPWDFEIRKDKIHYKRTFALATI